MELSFPIINKLSEMVKIVLTQLECTRCPHKWFPRSTELPRVCPKCTSPYWNKPIERKSVSKIQRERKRD